MEPFLVFRHCFTLSLSLWVLNALGLPGLPRFWDPVSVNVCFQFFLYISIVLYICVRCIDSKHPLLLLMRWFSNTLSIVNSLVTYPGHRPKLVNRLNLGNNSVNMQKTTEIDRKLQGNSTLVNPNWYKVATMSCKRGEIFPINVRNWMGFSGAKKLNSKILWSYYNP